MWRSFFIAIGAIMVIFGLEFLVVEKATYRPDPDLPAVQRVQRFGTQANANENSLFYQVQDEKNKDPWEFQPANWLPWAMISSGAIVILYSLTLRGGSSRMGLD